MPPKVKTDKEAIISAAFEVAKSEGITAITAQSVAKALNTSVAPIFRVFQTVEELRTATINKIDEFHNQYIKDYPTTSSAFLTYGLAYIQFAKDYPLLFETIMLPCSRNIEDRMAGDLAFAVDSASMLSGLNTNQSKRLFLNMWIYTHGIACLLYKGNLAISMEEEQKLLEAAFTAFTKND